MEEPARKTLRKTIHKLRPLMTFLSKRSTEEIPSNEEIEMEINHMFKEQLLNEDRKLQIMEMTPVLKWRLILIHKNMMKTMANEIHSVNIEEIQNFVDKLKEKLELAELSNLMNNLKRWFLNASEFQLKSFCMYDGVKYLFRRLGEAEVQSRLNKSFRMEIEILKFLQVISKVERGVLEILKVKNSLYLLLVILHPFNPDVTCISLEILMSILWQSSSSLDTLLNGLNQMKEEKNWQFRFYPLIKILENSNNIVIIKSILCFINTLVSCDKNENKRLEIKAELINSGIKNTLELIKKKISMKIYKLSSCTFERTLKLLNKLKIEPSIAVQELCKESEKKEQGVNLEEYYLQEKSPPRIDKTEPAFAGRRTSVRKTKSNFEQKKLTDFDATNIIKQMSSDQVSNESEEEEDDDEKLFDRTFYLLNDDLKKFSSAIQMVLVQIDFFEKQLFFEDETEEEGGERIRELKNIMGRENIMNLKELVDKIKNHTLQRNCFNLFLKILQFMILIPKDDKGDLVWKKFSDFLENVFEVEENEEGKEVLVLHSSIENEDQISKYQTIIANRDKDIKKLIDEKNELYLALQIQKAMKKRAIEKSKTSKKLIDDDETSKNMSPRKIQPSCQSSSTAPSFSIPPAPSPVLTEKPLSLSNSNISSLPAGIPVPPPFPEAREILTNSTFESSNKQIPPSSSVPIPPPFGESNIPAPPPFPGSNIPIPPPSNIPAPPPFGIPTPPPFSGSDLSAAPSFPNPNIPTPPPFPCSNIPAPPPFPDSNIPVPPPFPGSSIPAPPSFPGTSIPAPPPFPGSNIPAPPSFPGTNIPAPPPFPGSNIPPPSPFPGSSIPAPPPFPGSNIPVPPPFLGSNIPAPPPFSGSNIPAPPPFISGIPAPPPFGLGGSNIPAPPPFGGGGPGIPAPPPFLGSNFSAPGVPPPPPFFSGAPPPPSFPGAPNPPSFPGAPIPPPPFPGAMAHAPPGHWIGNVVQHLKPGEKEKFIHSVPLRGVMWNNIKFTDIKGTIFEKIDDKKVLYKKDELEKEFVKKETAPASKTVIKPKIEKISLIAPARSKQYDILLAKLKISIPLIGDYIFHCDQNFLTLNTLDLLLPAIPTEDEIRECKAYKGDLALLAPPEQLILELAKIVGLPARIKALHFRHIWKDYKADLVEKVTKLERVWGGLRNDERVHNLFEYVLALGNYLNGTTMRGGAWGFKFDGLEKIVDCKSTTNPKRNLLLVILELYEKNQRVELFKISEDFSDFDVASKVPVNQLEADLAELKKGHKAMEIAMKSQTESKLDQIKEVIEVDYSSLGQSIQSLELRIKSVNDDFKQTVIYFAEDPKETSDKIAKKFLNMFNFCLNNKKEIERMRNLIKKEEEKRKREEKKKEELEKKQKAGESVANKAIHNLKITNPIQTIKNNADDIIHEINSMREAKKQKEENELNLLKNQDFEKMLFRAMLSREEKKTN